MDADASTALKPGDEVAGAKLVELVQAGAHRQLWRGDADGTNVAVYALGPSASEDDAYRFHAAALKMLKLSKSAPAGVLRVRAVDPGGRAFVADLWTVGNAADLPALAWGMDRRLELFRNLCVALEGVHAAGLVHGGIAPGSVLLDDDLHPVIAAVEFEEPAALLGDPARAPYVAPELETGSAPTVASDVFAIGQVLHFLMLDRHPPTGSEEVPRLAELASTAPAGLVRILRKSISSSAARRYASVADLASDVARCAEWESVGLAHPEISETNPNGAFTPGQRVSALPEPRRAAPKPAAEPRAPASEKKARDADAGRKKPSPPVPGWAQLGALVGVMVVGASVALGYASGSFALVWQILSALGLAAVTLRMPLHAPSARLGVAAAAFVLGFLVDLGGRASVAGASGSLGSQNPHDVVTAIRALRSAGQRKFSNAIATGGDLSGINFDGTECDFVDFSSANLANTSFVHASLVGATLRDANIEGAVFTDANVMMIIGLEQARCDDKTKLPTGLHCQDGHPRP